MLKTGILDFFTHEVELTSDIIAIVSTSRNCLQNFLFQSGDDFFVRVKKEDPGMHYLVNTKVLLGAKIVKRPCENRYIFKLLRLLHRIVFTARIH